MSKKLLITAICLVGVIAVAGSLAIAKELITGYDTNNNYEPVQVEKGKYYPGVSLTRPADITIDDCLGAGQPRLITLLDSVTATTTSSAISLRGASKATLFLTAEVPKENHATSTFTITVSGDDANYVTYNKMIDNVTNSNAQDLTRVASKAYSATTTAMLSFDLESDVISSFKVTATNIYENASSTATAIVKALIEY